MEEHGYLNNLMHPNKQNWSTDESMSLVINLGSHSNGIHIDDEMFSCPILD